MSLLRILHISTATTWRGGEQQLAYLIDELGKGKAEQHVVCIADSPMHERCKQENVPYSTVGKRGGIDFRLASTIASCAKEFNAELIHTHDAHGHSASILACRFYKMRVPLIVSRRVDFHIHSAFSKRFKYGSKHVAKIICVSKAIEDIMAEDLGSRDKLCTVHDGVSLDRFGHKKTGALHQELGLNNTTKIIGNVAAHAPHKDLFTFIKTAKRIADQHEDVHFVSVGDGPESAAIKAFSKEQLRDEQISFLGFRTDVEQLLPEFDLFLMTSKTEGLGTSILDAFAAHVPVIATRAGGIPELIDDRVNGYLATVADDEELARSVLQALDSPQQQVIENAVEKLKQFSKENMADNTLKVYRSILAQR